MYLTLTFYTYLDASGNEDGPGHGDCGVQEAGGERGGQARHRQHRQQ